jgi:hypothetical protein
MLRKVDLARLARGQRVPNFQDAGSKSEASK